MLLPSLINIAQLSALFEKRDGFEYMTG